jgi:two-component system, LuxR family, sensor histidine kinase DctS
MSFDNTNSLSIPVQRSSFKRRLKLLAHNVLNAPRPDQSDPIRGWVILVVILVILSLLFLLAFVSFNYQKLQAHQLLENNTIKASAKIQEQFFRDVQTLQLLPKISPENQHQTPAEKVFAQHNALSLIETFQAKRPDVLRVQYWYSANPQGCLLDCVLLADAPSQAAPQELRRVNEASFAYLTLPKESQKILHAIGTYSTEQFSPPYTVSVLEKATLEAIKTNEALPQEAILTNSRMDVWVGQKDIKGYRYIRLTYDLYRVLSELIDKDVLLDSDVSLWLPNGQMLVHKQSFTHQSLGDSAKSELVLPGLTMQLQLISVTGFTRFIPNFLTSMVLYLGSLLVFSVVLLFIDVRKRLRVQKALEQQNALRKAMEDSLVTGLRARNMQAITTYVNPALCDMVGFSAEELIGGAPPFPYWLPENFSEYRVRHENFLAGTMNYDAYETIFIRKDGTRFPVLLFEAPLLNAAGEQTGWMSSIVDATKQKEMELMTRQQQEQLAQQARLATMGEISSSLSHELNQPLAAISSYATGTLNMLQANTASPDDVQEALKRISKQAQRAGQVIRSIHDFVRRKTPIRELIDVRPVLNGVYPLIELQAKQTFTKINIKMAHYVPDVLADRLMLEQVILNLTRNAFDVMKNIPADQRVLLIEIDSCQKSIVTKTNLSSVSAPTMHSIEDNEQIDKINLPTETKVRLMVSDQGGGVDAVIGQQIFSPFFSTKNDGMGMGLAICRTIIEAAHGTLWYENIAGGCRFVVELPAYIPSLESSNPDNTTEVYQVI